MSHVNYPQTSQLQVGPDLCEGLRVEDSLMRLKNRVRQFQLLSDEEEVRWECTYCEEQFEEHEVSHDLTVCGDEASAEGFCPNCS